ncbi:MAG: hypothetical protein Q8P46_04990 [Hyphomicrobiales bacterium]|nr:hypothetical protein [Hyphomicrobiales bacterium]
MSGRELIISAKMFATAAPAEDQPSTRRVGATESAARPLGRSIEAIAEVCWFANPDPITDEVLQ